MTLEDTNKPVSADKAWRAKHFYKKIQKLEENIREAGSEYEAHHFGEKTDLDELARKILRIFDVLFGVSSTYGSGAVTAQIERERQNWDESDRLYSPDAMELIRGYDDEIFVTAAIVSKLEHLLTKLESAFDGPPRPEQPDGTNLPKTRNRRKGVKDWELKAASLKQENPDCTNAQIAEQVGKHPSQLSRSEFFQNAKKMAEGTEAGNRRSKISIDQLPGTDGFQFWR